VLSQVVDFGVWEQHAYCILSFLRQALALTIAVNITALPLTLFYFHKFPVMGLVYNLFFPFLVSLSMMLLILACISTPVPWISQGLHHLNEYYTQFVLGFTFNLPSSFDKIWYVAALPAEFLLSYLGIVFLLGIALKETSDNKELTPAWMV